MEITEVNDRAGDSVEMTEIPEKNVDNNPLPTQNLKTKIFSLFSPLTLAHHPPLPENSSVSTKLKYSLLLPPHGVLADSLTRIIILVIIWSVSYCVLGSLSLPTQDVISISVKGGAIFTTLLLLVCAIAGTKDSLTFKYFHVKLSCAGGKLVEMLRLPPLLGMLLVGVMLANVPGVRSVGRLDSSWSSVLRSSALTIILIRAGLGLDPDKLKQLSLMVLRLAFLPCLTESCVVAVTSHFILGLPWLWAFLLGITSSSQLLCFIRLI